jgi:phosphatidylserine/phosphatidylglycerophosphate/cardiolipin synthase-like enzyme
MISSLRLANRTGYEWLAAMPAFLVLVFVIILNTSHATHAQLLKLGENIWDGYFQLRADPVQPSCDINQDIEAQLAILVAEAAAPAVEDEWDLFGDDPEPVDENVLRQSLMNAQAVCQTKHQTYEDTVDRITPAVKVFRTI